MARLHTSALREAAADAAEESRATHLLVQPRKESFCRPCGRMDQAQRQSWKEVQPLTSAAAPQPLPSTPSPSCSPGDHAPRIEKVSLLLWPEERSQEVAIKPLGSWTRRQNKTQNKKLSEIIVPPRGKSLLKSSQPTWPLFLLSPRERPA